MARTLVMVALAVLGGCSLVLEEPSLPSCTSDDQCAPLTELAGHPASCRKFFCGDGRCQEHPAGAEICDGHDNDCDGVVDEPSAVESGPARPGGVMVEGVASVASARHRYGAGPGGSAVATWLDRGEPRHAALVADSVGAPDPVGHMTHAEDNLRLSALQDGCRDPVTGGPVTSCNTGELVSDPTATHEILVSVATDGCVAGRVMVGHSPPSSAHEGVPIVLRGPLRRSNSFLGIDVQSGGRCTGESRPECTDEGGCGAARPSLAVIDYGVPSVAEQRRVAEALVAWIGAPASRDHCGGAEAPVEAVVAHLLRVQIGTPFFWATVSDEGAPAVLGRTTGGGAPAVAERGEDGWFVAFADAGGGVALRWIPSQPEPPVVGTDGAPEDRTGVETPPVDGIVDLGTLDGLGGAPDHVALSVGTVGSDRVDLGLAWLEGCGGADQEIVFRRVVVATDGVTPTGVEDPGDPVQLGQAGSGTTALGPPSITYSPSGFVVEGFERGGRTADRDTDGGWTVAFGRGDDSDGDGRDDIRGRILLARMSELDGDVVGEATLDVTQGDSANATAPFVYGGTRYAYLDRRANTFVGGPLACAP